MVLLSQAESPSLEESLRHRILVLDGAMGTMLQRLHLEEKDYRGRRFLSSQIPLKGNNDLLSLTLPLAIETIHKQYLEVGADIVETNTFGAQRISQADYGTVDCCYELNYESAKIARRACDFFTSRNPERPRWVAGSIGPTNRTLSISPDVEDASVRNIEFDQLVEAYLEQVRGLIDGGVDLLLVETIFDTLNAKAALYAIDKCFEETGKKLPLMISVTITDKAGRTLGGQTVEAFWYSVMHAHPLLVGINCALGAEEMRPYIKRLSDIAHCYISCYPNAGLPNASGGYDQTPKMMGAAVRALAEGDMVNLVGGCCGTSPEYIQAMAQAVSGFVPRVPKSRRRSLCLSGLESYVVAKETGFAMIGERTNLSGSAKFARTIREGDYEGALVIARNQVENGANIIDINLDDALLDSRAVMTKFLRMLTLEPDIAKVPVMVDSSHWEVLVAALKCLPGRSMVNSLSLKEGEECFKQRAKEIRRLGGVVVVMAFDEDGQATTLERKVAICTRAYEILVNELGFFPDEFCFDPCVLTVATGMAEHARFGLDFIEAVRQIKSNLPGSRLLGGISNVSFAFRGNNAVREAMHAVFLYHAINAGLDFGIVNAGMLMVYEDIPAALREAVEDVLLVRNDNATEHLVAIADSYRREAGPARVEDPQWRRGTVAERLQGDMVRGLVEYLEEDLAEARQQYKFALDIIEGPLMDGMKKVGSLFGDGKMFLPQVVKSARVMKKAVGYLHTAIEEEKAQTHSVSHKILLATVKGDVHDIGKNIVSVVLGCNGFEVIDAGVMVPANKILQLARQHKVDAIGLSALITPSLDEVLNVASELEREGFTIPLLVGGAAVSVMHTALRTDLAYSGPVIYVSDASKVAGVLSSALDTSHKSCFLKDIKREYDLLRTRHKSKGLRTEFWSLEEARQRAPKYNWETAVIPRPDFEGIHKLRRYDLSDLSSYIDWTQFFSVWGLRGVYPRILEDPERGDQARKLLEDGESLLADIVEDKLLQANGVYGFLPCNSSGDDLIIYSNCDRKKILATIPTLRQQTVPEAKASEAICYALSDFVAPVESGRNDWIGLFALSTGFGLDELVERYASEGDDYEVMLVKALADRLCEAFSERVHKLVRYEWDYGRHENLSSEFCLRGHYCGIRPAPGYSSCPDHSIKFILWKLLGAEHQIGMRLTETAGIIPGSSVCGLYFSHPEAKYFNVGKVCRDQVEDYAVRRGITQAEAEKWLAPALAYDINSIRG